MSTNCRDASEHVLKQKSAGKSAKNIDAKCPLPIHLYSLHMNGVDLFNQKRQYYEVALKRINGWKYVFHFVITACIVNSFIIYTLSLKSRVPKSKLTMLNHCEKLAIQLMRHSPHNKKVAKNLR